MPGRNGKGDIQLSINLEHFIRWIEKINRKIQENKEYLTKLDQVIGDGDHGINLSRGFKEVTDKMTKTVYRDIGGLLQDVGMVLISKVGGASGPLYGTAFMKLASVLKGKQEITISELAEALQESVSGIKTRGRAQTGDKTMLDVWEPVTAYIQEHRENLSYQNVIDFCKEQMEHTKQLEAKKGRASYLGSRSIGHLDPGAVSSFYLFETLCLILMESEVPQ